LYAALKGFYWVSFYNVSVLEVSDVYMNIWSHFTYILFQYKLMYNSTLSFDILKQNAWSIQQQTVTHQKLFLLGGINYIHKSNEVELLSFSKPPSSVNLLYRYSNQTR